MVSISSETPAATAARLRRVIAAADIKLYEQPFAFEEFALDQFPAAVRADALALVRDDETWSQLAPSTAHHAELFGVLRFHFPAGIDNSGFVGWLATHLKERFGTGVFVTCGHSARHGGIYDYWGCPIALHAQVVEAVSELRRSALG